MPILIQAVENLFAELQADPIGSHEAMLLNQILTGLPVTHKVLLSIIQTSTLVELFKTLEQAKQSAVNSVSPQTKEQKENP